MKTDSIRLFEFITKNTYIINRYITTSTKSDNLINYIILYKIYFIYIERFKIL